MREADERQLRFVERQAARDAVLPSLRRLVVDALRDERLHVGVTKLWQAIVNSPVLNDGTRVCVMTFSDNVKIPVPLTHMSAYPDGPPEFAYEQLTDYGEAFRVLAAEMAADYVGLRRSGYAVYRPCASSSLTASPPTSAGSRRSPRR